MSTAHPSKTILIVGATSGIGLALAERFIDNGTFVIAVGRRRANLDAFVEKHGAEKVSGFEFDIMDLDGIPGFVKRYVEVFVRRVQYLWVDGGADM
jgi:NADP-dependent 3-hydroxy acid dehydrogenase YdfG